MATASKVDSSIRKKYTNAIGAISNTSKQNNINKTNTPNPTVFNPNASTNSNTGITTNKVIKPSQPSSNVNNVNNNSTGVNANVTYPNDANSSILDTYKDTINKYNQDLATQEASDSSTAQAEADATKSKIEATNQILESYMQNQHAYASSKVQAQMAQQTAQNNTKAYMEAVGLGGQGVAETTMANTGNSYANAVANLEAEKNNANSNAKENYADAINRININKAEDINAVKDENAGIINSKFESAIDENGNYDLKMLDKYKAEADKMYQNGEISQAYYNSMLDVYNNAVEKQTNEKTSIGITDNAETIEVNESQPTYNGIMNTDAISSWLNEKHGTGTSSTELAQQLASLEDGVVVSLNHKTNVVKYNGKIYETTATASTSDGGLDCKTIKEEDFGKFNDTGKANSYQSNYINAIIEGAKQGKIPNGATIDVNYGNGTAYYQYKNGKWYPTSEKGSNFMNFDKVVETLGGTKSGHLFGKNVWIGDKKVGGM